MTDMARETVRDLDALAAEFMKQGLLKFRFSGAFVPITGANHKLRRDFGLD